MVWSGLIPLPTTIFSVGKYSPSSESIFYSDLRIVSASKKIKITLKKRNHFTPLEYKMYEIETKEKQITTVPKKS